MNIPLEDIQVVEQDIKIVFYKRTFTEQKFEVRLLLFEGSIEIGNYLYIENNKKEGIDDSLVFY